jgi:hypothetical protein
MAKLSDVAEPDAGTLPVPVQPVQTYLVPESLETGDVTDSNIAVPESNQPLEGVGESYSEVTVR